MAESSVSSMTGYLHGVIDGTFTKSYNKFGYKNIPKDIRRPIFKRSYKIQKLREFAYARLIKARYSREWIRNFPGDMLISFNGTLGRKEIFTVNLGRPKIWFRK